MKLKVIQCDGTPRIYCYFCDKDITPNDGDHIRAWFYCNHCPVKTKFIVSGEFSNPDIIFIQFFVEDYVLEACYDKPDLQLFKERCYPLKKGSLASKEFFYKLNHVPDINPSNAKYWLDKLLNLLPFS